MCAASGTTGKSIKVLRWKSSLHRRDSVCNATAQIPRPDEKQVVVAFDLHEREQPKVASWQINMMFCF